MFQQQDYTSDLRLVPPSLVLHIDPFIDNVILSGKFWFIQEYMYVYFYKYISSKHQITVI